MHCRQAARKTEICRCCTDEPWCPQRKMAIYSEQLFLHHLAFYCLPQKINMKHGHLDEVEDGHSGEGQKMPDTFLQFLDEYWALDNLAFKLSIFFFAFYQRRDARIGFLARNTSTFVTRPAIRRPALAWHFFVRLHNIPGLPTLGWKEMLNFC